MSSAPHAHFPQCRSGAGDLREAGEKHRNAFPSLVSQLPLPIIGSFCENRHDLTRQAWDNRNANSNIRGCITQSSAWFQGKAMQTTLVGNLFFNGPRAGINFNGKSEHQLRRWSSPSTELSALGICLRTASSAALTACGCVVSCVCVADGKSDSDCVVVHLRAYDMSLHCLPSACLCEPLGLPFSQSLRVCICMCVRL